MDKRLLIIDDDKDFRESLQERLERDNFIVDVSKGGYEGLEKATKSLPDLILLDITMPDIEGDEVLAKIKERKLKTRVIIVTGTQTSIKDVVKHIREGACDYYTKDMNIDVLINQIKRALSLETTINVKVSKPAPIIEEIIAKVERFSYENDELQKRNSELQKENGALGEKLLRITQLTPELINLGGLSFCILSALLFCYFVSINEVWLKFLLPIAFFVILKFPIDRLSKVFVKLPTSETNIELHPSDKKQDQLPKQF